MASLSARRRIALPCAGLFILAPWVAAVAQGVPGATPAPRRATCDGDTVTAIAIRAHPPATTDLASETRAAAARVLGVPRRETIDALVRAYLRLAVGGVCTERDRRESERLLRTQPFVAAAVVRALPGPPGYTTLRVDVVDEVRPTAAVQVRNGTLASVLAGTQNFRGRGLALTAHAERGFAYRDGFGLRVTQYGVFGLPAFVALEAGRHPIDGSVLAFELTEPYLTDLQRRAFHSSASLLSGYETLRRPEGGDASLFVRRTAYDIGWVTRLRRASGRGTVALVGAALLGEDVRAGRDLVVISDTGRIAVPANPYADAYPAFATTRVAAIGGLRALQFVTVRGFDALAALQDMGVGVQVDVLVGSSLLTPKHRRDAFIAADLYAGAGDASSFIMARLLGEARRVNSTHSWDGLVGSGRLAWYGNASGRRAHQASIELSGMQHLVFPAQLTFGDAIGGLPGFSSSPYAGGQRVVTRLEEQRLLRTLGARADVAVSVFAAAGKLWAGDVPFGRTSPLYASAGVALLGAFPAGGKRTYRLELAVPLNAERGGARFEIRVSASDRTHLLWLEPRDVARARTGAVPTSLMTW